MHKEARRPDDSWEPISGPESQIPLQPFAPESLPQEHGNRERAQYDMEIRHGRQDISFEDSSGRSSEKGIGEDEDED